MGPSNKITIYDLSRLSGCSASTVSAVLNGTWQKRRIRRETAEAILTLAADRNYVANRQARALRTATSGLIGLLLPHYGSHFFASVAQIFEAKARAAGLTPLVSSTSRDPALERTTLQDLASHALDALIICGAAEPDALDAICRRIGLPNVNIDLPGTRSHSVVSDSRSDAETLARTVIAEARARGADLTAEDVCFFGGHNDINTADRLAGFLAARAEELGDIGDRHCHVTGYSAWMTQQDIEAVIGLRGGPPRILYFASALNLEGLLRVMETHPPELFADVVVGCVGYDPFASFLPFPIWMMEHDVQSLLDRAFDLLPRWSEPPELHVVPARLIAPRRVCFGATSDPWESHVY